jgi:lipopolysaccharide/colanic/teichoic acid biosynthesis glycosyltransferase
MGSISRMGKESVAKKEWLAGALVGQEADAGVLLSQEQFRCMLCKERKRSERSHQYMLLMLIDHEEERLLKDLAGTLKSIVRETDIAGWFETNRTVGVIFTELGKSDAQTAGKAIESKVKGLLRNVAATQRSVPLSVSFYFFPENWSGNGRPTNFVLYPDLFELRRRRKLSLLTKRLMDIVGSACALVLLSPLFLLLATLAKLTSKGPVLYRQERVGQHGVPFVLLKFRSMHISSDEAIHKEYVRTFIAGRAQSRTADGSKKPYKITNDPRVTWVGRLMRRASLDELPQFWNVLRGDMALVGPRPPIPYELEAYDLWHKRRVLETKPGITGLWQVQGRSRTTFDEMVRLDLQYSRSWSPMLDLKILLQTPRAVFFGDGAY